MIGRSHIGANLESISEVLELLKSDCRERNNPLVNPVTKDTTGVDARDEEVPCSTSEIGLPLTWAISEAPGELKCVHESGDREFELAMALFVSTEIAEGPNIDILESSIVNTRY